MRAQRYFAEGVFGRSALRGVPVSTASVEGVLDGAARFLEDSLALEVELHRVEKELDLAGGGDHAGEPWTPS